MCTAGSYMHRYVCLKNRPWTEKGIHTWGGGDQAGQQVESKTHCHFGWISQNKNVFMYNLDDFLKEEMGKKKPTDTLAGKYTIICEYSKPGL